MAHMTINTYGGEETVILGRKFAKGVHSGDVVLLTGDLGAGKTTFVRGVVEGLGYKKKVLSPSFTLVRLYKVRRLYIYHVDLYRLSRVEDMFELGIEEYMYKPGNCFLIEWGEKIEDSLAYYLKLKFSFMEETRRKITITSKGYGKDKLRAL